MGSLATNMDASICCERKVNRHDAEAQALIDGSQSPFLWGPGADEAARLLLLASSGSSSELRQN